MTSAYAAVAGAYQSFRGQQMATTRMRPAKSDGSVAATPSGAAPIGNAATRCPRARSSTTARPSSHFKRGDLAGAMLQLKMAIGADPASAFLRTALLEVENEVRKTSCLSAMDRFVRM